MVYRGLVDSVLEYGSFCYSGYAAIVKGSVSRNQDSSGTQVFRYLVAVFY
jgi:hypothetical protein